MNDEIVSCINKIFENGELVTAVLSAPKSGEECSRLTIRPIEIKGTLHYQVTELKGSQAFHHNMNPQQCAQMLCQRITGFGQGILTCTNAVYHLLVSKKQKITMIKKSANNPKLALSHNRKKEYLIEEGIPVPFLIGLGIMNAEGKVYPAKMDKFRQINRFLEMVDDILGELDCSRRLHIVDFGCGKAYLTFAIYHYLKKVKGLDIHITGIDRKVEVVKGCAAWAEELGDADGFTFIVGDIESCTIDSAVDLAVSLHACDIATDLSMAKAVAMQAKALLFAPCCQHELFKQIKNSMLSPLLKHGILKERFAALATDAARAQILEILGYQTQMLEFVDPEHTPKNLLIRAVRKGIAAERADMLRAEYESFREGLGIHPTLERLVGIFP